MRIIILAAGHGTRMQHELPKPLVSLQGKPMIVHLLESIQKSKTSNQPIIVVSPTNKAIFEDYIGKHHCYVVQEKQLGTGHAVLSAHVACGDHDRLVMVLYGDHPLVSAETLLQISDKAYQSGAVITMATTLIPEGEIWDHAFQGFSRILRDEQGKIIGDVQVKDARPDQLQIREVNPCYFCFQADWLWKNLKKIKNNNAQQEYYLTDLVKIAFQEGREIATVLIEPREALGINTQEQLALIEELRN